jgi:hypothetical protein
VPRPRQLAFSCVVRTPILPHCNRSHFPCPLPLLSLPFWSPVAAAAAAAAEEEEEEEEEGVARPLSRGGMVVQSLHHAGQACSERSQR